jgi:hypothetical protein
MTYLITRATANRDEASGWGRSDLIAGPSRDQTRSGGGKGLGGDSGGSDLNKGVREPLGWADRLRDNSEDPLPGLVNGVASFATAVNGVGVEPLDL